MAYFHHLALQFPIAFGILAPVLIFIGWKRPPDDGWRRAALFVACAAAVGGIVAAASGLLAATHVIESGGDAARIGLHRNVGLTATGLFILAAASSWRAQVRRSFQWFAAAFSGMAALVGAAGAHLGGDMLHPGLAPWSQETHHHGPAEVAPPGSTNAPSAEGADVPLEQRDMPVMGHEMGAPAAPASPVASVSAAPPAVPASAVTATPPSTPAPSQHSGHPH